jgi:hypothetical protein
MGKAVKPGPRGRPEWSKSEGSRARRLARREALLVVWVRNCAKCKGDHELGRYAESPPSECRSGPRDD